MNLRNDLIDRQERRLWIYCKSLIYVYIYIYREREGGQCSAMVRETWIQSQVASYQRLLKWYLIPPCLTLNNIRYVSRLKWSNPKKGVAPSLTPRCSSYWKGNLLVALDDSCQLYLYIYIYIYTTCEKTCDTLFLSTRVDVTVSVAKVMPAAFATWQVMKTNRAKVPLGNLSS